MDATLSTVEKKEKNALKQLLELYSYDFTRVVDADVDAQGRFNYPLDQLGYFNNPDRKAYFIRCDKNLAGFVLIREEGKTFYMNEFFVLYKYRKHGIGKKIAIELFQKCRGRWIINQTDLNYPANQFWREIVMKYSKGKFEEIQENGRKILSFTS